MLNRRQFIQSTLGTLASRFIAPSAAYKNAIGLYLIDNGTPIDTTAIVRTKTEWMQIHLNWSEVVTAGWSRVDAIVNPLVAHGCRFVFMLFNAPGQQPYPRSQHNLLDESGNLDHTQLPGLTQVVAELMTRYKGQHLVTWIEEADGWWDSRNTEGRFDGFWGGKAAEFAEVLRAMKVGQEQARFLGSQGMILLSPVARENWANAGSRPTYDMEWLNCVSDSAGFDLVDWWGANYYDGFASHHGGGAKAVVTKIAKAKAIIPSRYHHMPIFVNTGSAEESAQPLYIRQSTAHLLAAPFLHNLNVQAHTVFCWQKFRGFGLLNQDGGPNAGHRQFCATNNLLNSRVINATGNLDQGYSFLLLNGSRHNVQWKCNSAGDIQSIAALWPNKSTVIDIQDSAKGFNSC